MNTGWGLVILGLLYIGNTIIGIALSAWRDRWLQKSRLAAEQEQAETMAAGASDMNVNLRTPGKPTP